MKIGFCAKPDQIEAVAAAGFDYIELPVNYIAGLTEEDFSACLDAVRAAASCIFIADADRKSSHSGHCHGHTGR